MHATSPSTATTSGAPATAIGFDPTRRHRLSRHTVLRPAADGTLHAENPLHGRSMTVGNGTQVALLLQFLDATRPTDLLADLDDARRQALLAFISHCHDIGLLTALGEDGLALDESSSLAHWEAHDLLFHLNSRRGRASFPVGATHHLADVVPPEPAFKAPACALAVPLPRRAERPHRAGVRCDDDRAMSLDEALESRRTVYSAEPVALDTLGELLYRTSRITDVQHLHSGEQLVRRVYPSGGALHPLELYVIPARCPGLELGIYHYRPREHALASVAGAGPDVDHLLEEARLSTGTLAEPPSVLLVLAARFRRVTRKYQGLAYALVLKEVGAAFQTFYLVATEMGLAPCALGSGNSDRFARAAGTDYYAETSVGEFILGGPPAGSAQASP